MLKIYYDGLTVVIKEITNGDLTSTDLTIGLCPAAVCFHYVSEYPVLVEVF